MDINIHIPEKFKNLLWILALVVAGVMVMVLASLFKSSPQKADVSEHSVKVRSIEITKIDVTPRAIGYGRVKPTRTWDAVAEVAGQVIWIADELRDGMVVTAGTELLRIEPSNYRLLLAQAEAQLRASEVRAKTASDSLEIAKSELELLRTDYERKKELSRNGTISQASVDTSERTMLAGQANVTNLQNSINLNMAEHDVAFAVRDAAKLDLERTHKIAPFNARITTVNIGVAQYANKGQLMFSADALDRAEVAAQFPLGAIRPLVNATQTEQADHEELNGGVRSVLLSLNAVMRLNRPTHSVTWPAKVSHVTGAVDPLTQSFGVVVAVDNPDELTIAGERPPLLRNTFIEVELSAPVMKDQVVVPLTAVHEGMVYVIDENSRLRKRNVEIAFSQRGYVVVQSGLGFGEHIVVSDMVTAIDGMLLDPQEDTNIRQQMLMEATGQVATGEMLTGTTVEEPAQ